MNARERISTSAKAKMNAEKLRSWIQRTTLEQVPTNQYGGASRSAILTHLCISRSSSTSNSDIAELFEDLDALLRVAPKRVESVPTEVLGNFEQHSYCMELHRENLRLKAEVRRLRWSEDTGRNVDDD